MTPDDTYVLSNTVGGTCAAGTWNDNVYTTGAVTADCTVIFSATQASFTVTPSAAAELMVNPSEPQTVADGSTQAFTLFANVGYSVSQVVGGDCPAGSWSDNVYTTGPIIADCAVSFSAAIDTFTVTSSGDGNETISPSTPQTVEYDSTQSFVVTANTGFAVSLDVGGTCPTGSWSDNVYTTGTITSDCAVIFAAAASATTITASLSTLNLATSGTNRVIVFTNTGSAPTSGLQAQFPTFPVGTSSDFADCASGLGAGDSCAIVVSPGATASTEPLTITVSGDNTNTLNVQVNVVTYGSILQGGYVFAIDDTTASTSSIGGSIAGLTDITSGVQWGAPTLTLATSLTDGATDTAIIVAAYGVGNYAAALCANFSIDDGGNSPCAGGTCFDSWYLPSVCELASSGGSASCPSGIANMTDNLDSLIDGCEGPSCLLGGHWSSSELSFNASFLQNFEPVAASQSLNSLKQGNVAVRCARALTP